MQMNRKSSLGANRARNTNGDFERAFERFGARVSRRHISRKMERSIREFERRVSGIKPKIKKLSNGVSVIMERDTSVHDCAVLVVFRFGSRDENARTAGRTHLLEHLLFRGPVGQDLQRAGKSISAGMNADTLRECVSFSIIANRIFAREAAETVSLLVSTADFPQEHFDLEREVVLGEFGTYADDPCLYSEERLYDVMFNIPMSRSELGLKQVIRRSEREMMLRFYMTRFTADNAFITVAGNFNESEVVKALESSLLLRQNGLRFGRKSPKQFYGKRTALRPELDLAHISIGAHGGGYKDPLLDSFFALNILLGAGAYSWLYEKVRDEFGLCYSITSDYSYYSDCGLLDVYADPALPDAVQVFSIVVELLKKVAKGEIPESEYRDAINQLAFTYIEGQNDPYDRAVTIAECFLHTGRVETAIQKVEQSLSVKSSLIAKAAQVLLANRMSVSCVAPGKPGISYRDLETDRLQ